MAPRHIAQGSVLLASSHSVRIWLPRDCCARANATISACAMEQCAVVTMLIPAATSLPVCVEQILLSQLDRESHAILMRRKGVALGGKKVRKPLGQVNGDNISVWIHLAVP